MIQESDPTLILNTDISGFNETYRPDAEASIQTLNEMILRDPHEVARTLEITDSLQNPDLEEQAYGGLTEGQIATAGVLNAVLSFTHNGKYLDYSDSAHETIQGDNEYKAAVSNMHNPNQHNDEHTEHARRQVALTAIKVLATKQAQNISISNNHEAAY